MKPEEIKVGMEVMHNVYRRKGTIKAWPLKWIITETSVVHFVSDDGANGFVFPHELSPLPLPPVPPRPVKWVAYLNEYSHAMTAAAKDLNYKPSVMGYETRVEFSVPPELTDLNLWEGWRVRVYANSWGVWIADVDIIQIGFRTLYSGPDHSAAWAAAREYAYQHWSERRTA